uniref:SHSP domain-containing protein n=1 Tax=Strongyloides papillosus TaxID=174720 RepID=A0A0N5CHQ7_STREA
MDSNSPEREANTGEEGKSLYNFGNCVDQITNDSQKFSIKVNISHFSPNEISVNVVDDKIVIEGFHKEKDDEYGSIQRHFIRKYSLPNGVDKLSFITSFQNGILNINAKKISN